MAVLSDADRAIVTTAFMSQCSGERRTFGAVVKADVRAMFDALDNFLNTNAATINNQIPTAAKTALTANDKALALQLLLQQRYRSGV